MYKVAIFKTKKKQVYRKWHTVKVIYFLKNCGCFED